MSKTTIPTGGITADAIDATLIADDAISDEHIDITAITGQTALAAAPADTDEFLINDGGTLKRIDASYISFGRVPHIVVAEQQHNFKTTFPFFKNLEGALERQYIYLLPVVKKIADKDYIFDLLLCGGFKDPLQAF